MKRPHRRIHFIIWLILTPIIIIASLLIIGMRPPQPYADLDAISDNRSD